MIFVGIDNGLNGAIVAIDEEEHIVYSTVMPTIGRPKEYDINEIVRIFNNTFEQPVTEHIFIALEKAHVRPVSGKRASFMTGKGYGIMQGILGTLNHSYIIVTPQTWMKKVIGTKTKDKKPSIMFCQRKYPNYHWGATKRSKKPHDGLTDALGLAIYARKYYRGDIQ